MDAAAVAVVVVDNCPNCPPPHVQFKASAKAWQPEDKTQEIQVLSV
jgi:hypothetical protein